MASIYRAPNKRWKATIRKAGFKSRSKTFDKFKEAQQWVKQNESSLEKAGAESLRTLAEVLKKYADEEAARYRSPRTMHTTLRSLGTHLPNISFPEITSQHIAHFRDKRLSAGTSPSTIRKELNLLSKVYDVAQKEWLYPVANRVREVRRPSEAPARTRRPSKAELAAIQAECIRSNNPAIWLMVELAIETGMRQGELLGINVDDVDLKSRTIHLALTKNGSARDVPLSEKAFSLISNKLEETATSKLFSNWQSGDGFRSTFRRVCHRAGVSGLRFHDLRHEAASRLFEKGLNQFQVAAITGHKSLQSLQRYTHLRARDLVNLLK